MKDMQFTHKWVLVTGASSGLGLEMATQLAEQHQANLILVARREAQLLALKQRLEQSFGIQCHVIAADLSLADDVERVYQQGRMVKSFEVAYETLKSPLTDKTRQGYAQQLHQKVIDWVHEGGL